MFLLFFLFLLVLSFLIKMKILLLGLFVSYIRINAPIVVVVVVVIVVYDKDKYDTDMFFFCWDFLSATSAETLRLLLLLGKRPGFFYPPTTHGQRVIVSDYISTILCMFYNTTKLKNIALHVLQHNKTKIQCFTSFTTQQN